MRISYLIIFHLSKLWKATFFMLCDVMFLVRLQGKFDIDHLGSERVKLVDWLNRLNFPNKRYAQENKAWIRGDIWAWCSPQLRHHSENCWSPEVTSKRYPLLLFLPLKCADNFLSNKNALTCFTRGWYAAGLRLLASWKTFLRNGNETSQKAGTITKHWMCFLENPRIQLTD